MSDAERWAGLDSDEREQTCWQIGLWTDLHFSGMDENGPLFVGEDRQFRLVLGQRVRLGWKGTALSLTPDQRAAAPELLAQLRRVTGRPRTIELPTFMVQVDAEPVYDALEEMDEDDEGDLAVYLPDLMPVGFRRLTADEWEGVYRAGNTTLFPWGDAWPTRSPADAPVRVNSWGLEFDMDPYALELVHEGFIGGDGGHGLERKSRPPTSWMSAACAYRPPEDILDEPLEYAALRLAKNAAPLSKFLD